MSSSDAQPPLSRREARERERAAAAGSQPATPPPTVTPPADQRSEERRRPGSHVAPSPTGPAQRSAAAAPGAFPLAPASGAEGSTGTASPASPAPASATEIVPGTGGLTRRQLRLRREAEGQAVQPVPLRAPTPQSSDRTVQDVLGSVDRLETDERPTPARPGSAAASPAAPEPAVVPPPSAQDAPSVPSPAAPVGSTPTPSVPSAPEPAETVRLDAAAVAQATEADGSPDALEPLSEAAAHAEEPRRHRSTWASPDEDTDTAETAITPAADLPTSSTPVVFPLSLDDDTNEVPVQRPTSASGGPASGRPASADDAPRVPASFARQTEPKPVTTAFAAPAGHWSQLADDANDAEVHDEETGARRVAVQNTNSIVLPDSALADPTGALNATGEVILTGSIDLPASLSSTGSHRPIDGAEVDRLLEQHDEQPETDASPVRASRAISSHTSTRQVVLAAAKPKESRTPVILGVTVGAVGLAAAAVIIVALVTTHMGG